jgi:hypothetical protein
MQYVPSLIAQCNKRELARLMAFQARILFWALWELKVLAPDFATLGIEPREVLERGRRKQLAAFQAASEALGVLVERERNPVAMVLNGAVDFCSRPEGTGLLGTFENAWAGVLAPRPEGRRGARGPRQPFDPHRRGVATGSYSSVAVPG